tara:strand:- start:83 stop:1717 length:1635 start_codon:yes stop_codon:yes gene_type:complete
MATRRKKKRDFDLRNVSIFLVFLGAFLIVISVMDNFTGYVVYDPYVSGDDTKIAMWNYSSATNYLYNDTINFTAGQISLLKPGDYVETLTTEFDLGGKDEGKINVSDDEVKLALNNGTYYAYGTFTSATYDSENGGADWNSFSWNETLNNQILIVYYRAGDVSDLSSLSWNSITNGGDVVNDGQYFQYKIEFASDGVSSAIVHDATLTSNYVDGSLETLTYSPTALDTLFGFYASDGGSGVTYAYDVGAGWVDVVHGADLSSVNASSIKIRVTLSSESSFSYGFNVTYNVSNSAPVLDSIGDKTLTEDVNFYLDVDATDVDEDTLTFSDDTDLFDIDASTGVINFTPDDSENYTINITVSDGVLEDSELVEWEVKPAEADDDDDDSSDDSSDKSNEKSNSKSKVTKKTTSDDSSEDVVDTNETDTNETVGEDLDVEVSGEGDDLFASLLTGFGFVTGDVDPKTGGAILLGFVLIGAVAAHFLFYVKGYGVNRKSTVGNKVSPGSRLRSFFRRRKDEGIKGPFFRELGRKDLPSKRELKILKEKK